MGSKRLRLFFAVNLPQEVKEEIAEKLLPEIPKDKWRKVKAGNCHITMRFLGYMPDDAVRRIEEQAGALKDFDCFEAELTGIGHFKNRVIWVGTGKGTEELNLLSKKLCSALGVQEERFHAHVTLARNRGSGAKETDSLIERLRKKGFSGKIVAESIDLMESVLHTSGPEYKKLFSVRLRALR
jgi:2'-5' RNA ligase